MNFSRKIFIAVFGSTLFLCSTLIWLAYHFTSVRTKQTYLDRYTSISRILGNSITQLERTTENLMYNAALVVANEDKKHGTLSTKELKRLSEQLGMTHLFSVDTLGNFTRSTNVEMDKHQVTDQ